MDLSQHIRVLRGIGPVVLAAVVLTACGDNHTTAPTLNTAPTGTSETIASGGDASACRRFGAFASDAAPRSSAVVRRDDQSLGGAQVFLQTLRNEIQTAVTEIVVDVTDPELVAGFVSVGTAADSPTIDVFQDERREVFQTKMSEWLAAVDHGADSVRTRCSSLGVAIEFSTFAR